MLEQIKNAQLNKRNWRSFKRLETSGFAEDGIRDNFDAGAFCGSGSGEGRRRADSTPAVSSGACCSAFSVLFLVTFAQPDAWSAAVLVDELDAGGF